MKSVKSYTFKIKTVEKSWSVSLRRFPGKPRIRTCRNAKGKRLSYKSYIIGDKLIALISGPATIGTLEIDFVGDDFIYFNLRPWYVRVYQRLTRLWRKK